MSEQELGIAPGSGESAECRQSTPPMLAECVGGERIPQEKLKMQSQLDSGADCCGSLQPGCQSHAGGRMTSGWRALVHTCVSGPHRAVYARGHRGLGNTRDQRSGSGAPTLEPWASRLSDLTFSLSISPTRAMTLPLPGSCDDHGSAWHLEAVNCRNVLPSSSPSPSPGDFLDSEGGEIEPGGRNRKWSMATGGPLGQGWRGRRKGHDPAPSQRHPRSSLPLSLGKAIHSQLKEAGMCGHELGVFMSL